MQPLKSVIYIPLDLANLISYTPQENRRMIPVPHNKIPDVPVCKGFKIRAVEYVSLIIVFIKNFIENQQSHLISQLQKFRCCSIMAVPDAFTPMAFIISNWRSMALG
jgi:hypothetical protein